MIEYLTALEYIMNNGIDRSDRTGVGTRSVFSYQMRFNLSDGFPAITTKKLAFKSVVSELLWLIEGSTDERRLAEIRYGKPREELIGKTTIWTANADKQGKDLGYENTDLVKELGPIYGKQWRRWDAGMKWGEKKEGDLLPMAEDVTVDQLGDVIENIKKNPYDRRHIVSAWNPGQIAEMTLPPCHLLFNFYVADNKLSCHIIIRSQDMFLGNPFNVASYALLTHMIAQVCNLNVGELVLTANDAHIYSNHFEQVREQLTRTTLPLATLKLNSAIKNIDDFTMDDIELVGYQSHAAIKAEMAI